MLKLPKLQKLATVQTLQIVMGLGLLASVPALLPVVRAQQVEELPRRVPAAFMTYRGAGWLERHEREDQERPSDVVRAMKLSPGLVVADIGCGSGYMARKMAPLVAPKGKVYCVDIQQEMLTIASDLAKKEGITGIVPILGGEDDPKLPAKGEVDWMILVDVYHEFSKPEAMLARMREALSPTGKIALVEYRMEDGSADIVKPDHRMSIRQVLNEWEAAGFRMIDLQESLPMQHLIVLEANTAKSGAAPLTDVDLADALAAKTIEQEVVSATPASLKLKVRRKGQERLVVTAQAGTYFASQSGARDVVAARDASIPLFDNEWHEWTLMSATAQRVKPLPAAGQAMEVQPASKRLPVRNLMHYLQAGGLPAGVVQAALLIAVDDSTYADIEPFVQSGPLTNEMAVGFALYFCEKAGVDITLRKVWGDRTRIIDKVSDENLRTFLKNRL